ncbi:hypothetical protein HK101_005894 [Irineochytrium annulatum]|nr:hypothetical protein HK101_005894 [Irineochytrium annulatum]
MRPPAPTHRQLHLLRPVHPVLACAPRPRPPTLLGANVVALPSAQVQVRHKTFRKKESKTRRHWRNTMEKLKEQGITPYKVGANVLENKFWKVVGNMKIYKPVTPGLRNRRHATRFHLHKGSAIKRLSWGKRSTGGRTRSTGRITIHYRGGGHKKRYRIIDFHRNIPGPHEVVRLEYDPNRTADIALLRNLSTNEFSYIIRPNGVNPGDRVESYRFGIPEPRPGEEPIPKNQLIQRGNCLRIRDIPVGTEIHCISLRPDGPAQIARAAGSSGRLIATDEASGLAQVRMVSKEVRMFGIDCVATVGVVGNEDHQHRNLGKAGASRRLGRRPRTRGIAKNAVDHPHGGGRKSKGNKQARSRWGWLTKGWKTVRRKKWFIVLPRWKANLKK